MDISKTYIKLCEKAEELQNQWEGREIHDGYNRVRQGIVYFRDDVLYQEGRRVTWLPRQDQLQEVLLSTFQQQEGGYLPTYWLIHKFEHWLPDCRYVVTSIEQLWLSFVMSELHQKIWNGTDWVKS